MNLAHLHILLNHFPTVGLVLALGLLLYALVRKDHALERVTLGVFCVLAIVAVLAYQTGNAARTVIAEEPGVSEELIVAHQDAAMRAFVFMMITGALAWFGLWQFHSRAKLMRVNTLAVLLASAITLALMTRAATMGGEIRHPEVRAVQEIAAAEPSWFSATAVANVVNNYPLVWSISESVHFIGLSLLFGVASLVSLRLLGMMKNLPFDPMRLLPLGLLGFGLNLITGMVFFIATPGQYTENIAFYWKMVLMLVAVGNILCLMVFDDAWKLGPGDEAPRFAKVLAGSTMVLWIGVLYFGRMLPFIGNSF